MSHQHGAALLPPANPLLCAMCNHEGTRCTGCLEIRYCSRECQRSDWPCHKLVCKTFAQFSDRHRPTPHHKRAVLFPQDDDRPHFVWIDASPCTTNAETLQRYREGSPASDAPAPWLEEYVGAVHEFLSEGGAEKLELINPVLHREIGHGIMVVGRHQLNFVNDTRLNKSLLTIDKELQEVWSGNVVAYGFSEDTEYVHDLDFVDFRHVVDIMRHIYDHRRREHIDNIDGPTVTGAFIPCAAEEKLGCRSFEVVPVCAAQCDAQNEVASPIMTRIGIPLVFRRLPLETRWRDRKLGVPDEIIGWNPSLRPFDPTIPLCDRRHGVGSAIVVRKDGKPLCMTHVAAFIDYARNKVVSYCHDNRETARAVLDSCTKEDFMAWYARWKGTVTGVDVDVPSPFDVESDTDLDLSSGMTTAGLDE